MYLRGVILNVLSLKQICKCGNEMLVVRIEPLYEKNILIDTNLVFKCNKCYYEKISERGFQRRSPEQRNGSP